jgi:membrane-associated phospholipid phosphatase
MWGSISNLGDAALTLPLALCCAAWIATSSGRLAIRWLTGLACAMAVVGATKIAYAGCGLEIQAIGFRVISGHTMLASAAWTTVMALLFAAGDGKRTSLGIAIGLLVGAVIGVARVFDDAHTASEVVIGWGVGAAVALLFIRALSKAGVRPKRPVVAATVLLLVSSAAYGHHAPFQAMIERYSLGFCSRWL